MPWPYTALVAGSLLALLSLWMNSEKITGSMLLFGAAALVILAGLVGLILYVKKEPAGGGAAADDTPRTLNVYKRHDCAVTPALAEKFAEIETSLAEGMKGQNVAADWDTHGKLVTVAQAAVGKPDVRAGFRARCESLLFLAEAFHKSRHKQESFRPSWTSPARE